MDYYVFVLQKEEKYIKEVISYLVQQEHKLPPNDFLDERGILSASMSSEDATALKLRFPYITLMPVGAVLDMIGQISPELKSRMTHSFDEKDYSEWDDEWYDDGEGCPDVDEDYGE